MKDLSDQSTLELPGLDIRPTHACVVAPQVRKTRSQRIRGTRPLQLDLLGALGPTDLSGLPVWHDPKERDLCGLPVWK